MHKAAFAGMVVMMAMVGAAVRAETPTTQPQSPTTAPAASMKPPALIAKLNTLPKAAWPAEGELATRKQAREDWVSKNVLHQTPQRITGQIVRVSETVAEDKSSPRDSETVSGPSPKKKAVSVELDCGPVTFWGLSSPLTVTATLPDLSPEKTMTWKAGDVLTISGKIESIDFGSVDATSRKKRSQSGTHVKLGDSTFIKKQ